MADCFIYKTQFVPRCKRLWTWL